MLVRLCPLVPVRQSFPRRALPDVAAAVRSELESHRLDAGLRPGARIALAAGSRGIVNYSLIVNTAMSWFADRGFQPFVVPAMGSHAGGTAEGQKKLLATFGISDNVDASIDVLPLGTTEGGIEVKIGRAAAECDGVILINRVKWHTTFEAPVESGLMKMAAIGLGKIYGAQEYHRHIVRRGFESVIREVGRHVIASGHILGGIAILEDANHETAEVRAIPAARIEDEETELLARVKTWMGKLPFPEIDILIVDEIGKHISGVAMDSKVINRHPYGTANPWPWLPHILRVYARRLKHGNANGFGMADMISDRLWEAVDWEQTKVNALTACNLTSVKTPLRAPNDLEAMRVLAAAVGRRDPADVTCVWIRNTLELAEFFATENLGLNGLERLGPAMEWPFDAAGDLVYRAAASS